MSTLFNEEMTDVNIAVAQQQLQREATYGCDSQTGVNHCNYSFQAIP